MTIDSPSPSKPPPYAPHPTAAAPSFGVAADGDARVVRAEARVRSAGWFVRRAFVGVLLLTVFVVGSVALLHATIEPDATNVSSAEE